MGIRLDAEERLEFLRRGHTGVVTTLRRDGWPVSLPVWYVVVGGKVYLATPPASMKVKRIRHDERCSFLVESGQKWAELAAVEFRAKAVLVEPGPEADTALAELNGKYGAFQTPYEQMPLAVQAVYGERTVIRLDPTERVLSWDNSRIPLNTL